MAYSDGEDGPFDSVNSTFPVGASVQGIEIVNIVNVGPTAAQGLTDASKYTGVEQLWQANLAASVTKASDGVTVGFDSVSNMTADFDELVTTSFTGEVASIALKTVLTTDGGGGDGDFAFRVGIEGADITTVNIGGSLNNETSKSATGYNGYGRLQITSSDLSSLETINLAMTTNTDFGAFGDVVNALIGSVTTINGSASTGGLDLGLSFDGVVATSDTALESITTGSGNDRVALTLGINTTALAVALGAGNDTLTLHANSVLTSNQITITGGEGADTLKLDGADAKALYATTTKTAISGFETLHIVDLEASTNAAKLASFSSNGFIIEGADASGSLINLQNAANITIRGDLKQNVTLAMLDPSGSADSMNLTIRSADDSKVLTIADVETLNIVSSEKTAKSGDANVFDLDAGGTKVINITGTNDLTFDTSSVFTKVTTVDASALKGAFVADFSTAEQGVTVTVGSKGSIIEGSAYADKLVGGAGSDVFIGGALSDTLTLGGGADIVVFTTFATADRITDFIIGGANASADLLSVDIAAFETELGKDLVNGGGEDLIAGDGVYQAVLSGATLGALSTVIGLRGAASKADAESLLATMSFNEADTEDVVDGDGLMVAYQTATGVEFGVAVLQVSTLDIDSASIKVVGVLEGVTLAQLSSANFNFI